ncbi:H(+)/Cl(-) exchange transporter ClcA [Ruminiclostridium cellobioparum]|uniref:H(+)/Cl(-) exchange transporter ClcA n=1 Tax=Ruminiclostridium cellobioparum TaxID=29355 RepID=UPI0004857268|nr:H(+)/Cl(-) exchange transporter ClcA [Ruminiclostridium cellobioparum]
METINRHNTYNTLFHWHSFRLKLVFEGIAVGILAGLLVVLYRFALERAMVLLQGIYGTLSVRPQFIPVWLGVLLIIGVILGKLTKYEPMAGGSGIPQVEGVLLRKLKMNWWKVIVVKFFGGILAIGSGLSLGREGPSVQLGAAAGQGLGKMLKRVKLEEKYLITSGASAGLAAAFNAPLAGVMFALEEVHKNFSPLVLLSSLAAALSADYISSGFFGLKPVFNLQSLSVLPLKSYLYIVVLGALIGVLGVLFNKSILKTQLLYSKLNIIPKELWVIIPLVISVVLGFILPQVLGGGHDLIVGLLTGGEFPLAFLFVLLLVKFLFTMISYGSGAPGGIFLPLLSIGALIGGIYGLAMVNLFNMDSNYINSFIVLAMAGYFTAVVRAPITGIILITEMTGSFNHLLSLAIVSVTAYIVADLLGSKPIYESLLERILQKQGNNDAAVGDKKHKSILEFAVCMGSMVDGKQVRDIKLPSHCLMVAVRRGEREIIPNGDTVLCAGDYLIVLTNDDRAAKINDSFAKLCGSCEVQK